ncbi:MAG: FG-GAP repeat protein [Planctomycetes bacterium]|nr:FG-GAP repeat protein [Planctomycetota bacterium]
MRIVTGIISSLAILALGMEPGYAQVYDGDIVLEDQRLSAAGGDWQDFYGSGVAVDGRWAIVGEHNRNVGSILNVGVAHFFERTPRGWVERQAITPLDANRSDKFGRTVAISGNTAVVGVPNHDNGAISTGAVYVYTLANGVWGQTQKLEAGATTSGFGLSLGLDGDSLIVGAPVDGSIAYRWGKAYAFERIAGTWTLVQTILPIGFRPSAPVDLHFGYQVSLHGDEAVISTYTPPIAPAFVVEGRQVLAYQRRSGVWVQTQIIGDPRPYDPQFGDYEFGLSTALYDGVLAIGAPRHGGFWGKNGKVSLYDLQPNGTWLHTQDVESSRPLFLPSSASDYFGDSVALHDRRLAVGAPRDSRVLGGQYPMGQAYVFDRGADGTWEESLVLRNDSAANVPVHFGESIALTEDYVFVGDPLGRDSSGVSAGSAHIFELSHGSTYCTSFWNALVSTWVTGSLVASENLLTVHGRGFFPGQFGLLLAGTNTGHVVSPGGSLGNLCLGGRLARIRPAVADSAGEMYIPVDTQAIPLNPTVAIQSGETWYFQVWYRDQTFGATSLFSPAIQVDFE